MNPVSETAKVATGFFKVMQNEPLSLALCIMNLSLILFIYIQSSQFTSQRSENVKLFTDVQREVQKLLSECIVPPRQQRGGALPEDPNAPTNISHPLGER